MKPQNELTDGMSLPWPVLESAPELLWLVQRAHAIRNAKGWTKAERERSWVEWEEHYSAAIAKATGHPRTSESVK